MPKPRIISYECVEQFETWLRAHCPCAFDDPKREFFRGLLFICEEEVMRSLSRERNRIFEELKKTSLQ